MNGDPEILTADSNSYRPDIDGLRAIAVLVVVIYHAFPSLVPGGFIGVDIFFVISGYLISKLIFEQIQTKTFSIKTFYARRVRRIFPGLIVVLASTTIVGWVILTPQEYKSLGYPIAGGAGFLANFVFWREAGYFDIAADSKPLLHLWSLGVEEQFYILWPLLLIWVARSRIRRKGRILAGVLLASLVYSIPLVYRDSIAGFYSPLARFWELGIGAAVAYAVVKGCINFVDGRQRLFALIGCTLLLLAGFFINSSRSFPGGWALLPTIGTACLILAGIKQGSWINNRILGCRPLVWLGLVSYPLYLWHWPLLSFARILHSETPPSDVRLILICVGLLLAWLTYRFIERPIRKLPLRNAKRFVLPLAVLMLLLFVVGITIRKMDGVKHRVLSKLNGDVSTLTIGNDRDKLAGDCGLSDAQKKLFQWCLTSTSSPPRFAVFGDSKGEALFYGLAREVSQGTSGLLIGSVGLPKINVLPEDKRHEKNSLAFETVVSKESVEVVFLVNALRSTFDTDKATGFVTWESVKSRSEEWIERYSLGIRRLEASGKRVVLVIDHPTFPDPRSCIAGGMTNSPFLNQFLRRRLNPRCELKHSEHLEGTAAYREFISRVTHANPNLIVYDPTHLLCDLGKNRCLITHDNKFLYSYSDHYSDYGNSRVSRDLLSMLYLKNILR